MSVAPTRIAIVDDHQLLIDGLVRLINESGGFELVGTYTDPRQALEELPNLNVEVLLADLDMPQLSGPELIRQLRPKIAGLKTVVLTMHLDPITAKKLIKLGVDGYLLKSDDSDDFVLGLKTVAKGKSYYSPRVTQMLHQEILQPQASTYAQRIHLLTGREREVLTCVAEGLTTKEISEKLFVSVSTIETHRKALLEKLEVKNVAGLVRVALKEGLV